MFDAYSHAIVALAGYGLLMFVLTILGVVGRTRDVTDAAGNVLRDYENPVYRRSRAHANAMESVGPFVAATVAAILAGADPFWVNLLASLFLAARVAMAAVHIATTIEWLRSATWTVGFICAISMAVMAILAAI